MAVGGNRGSVPPGGADAKIIAVPIEDDPVMGPDMVVDPLEGVG